MNALEGSGKWFDELGAGDAFASAVTVTQTHLVLGAGLIGDFNPHHTNAEFAKGTRFGTPILHGMMTSAIMGAAVGMYFHGTAIAYLEHRARFLAPVRAGDTLMSRWTIAELIPKPAHHGGIVVMTGRGTIQDGTLVAEADAKMLVATR